jgi:hypothetical protein
VNMIKTLIIVRGCHDPGFYKFLGENFRFYFAYVD